MRAFGLAVNLREERLPFASVAGVRPRQDAGEPERGKSHIRARAESCKASMNSDTNGFWICARLRLRMKPAEQFHGLVFDVRDAVQKVGNIIVRAIGADRTDRQTGETGLTTFVVERRRFANCDCIYGTNAETCRAI